MRITDLPVEQRPRERLRRLGPDALTHAEVVAILMGSQEIECIPGLGPAASARTMAAAELRRRATLAGPVSPAAGRSGAPSRCPRRSGARGELLAEQALRLVHESSRRHEQVPRPRPEWARRPLPSAGRWSRRREPSRCRWWTGRGDGTCRSRPERRSPRGRPGGVHRSVPPDRPIGVTESAQLSCGWSRPRRRGRSGRRPPTRGRRAGPPASPHPRPA